MPLHKQEETVVSIGLKKQFNEQLCWCELFMWWLSCEQEVQTNNFHWPEFSQSQWCTNTETLPNHVKHSAACFSSLEFISWLTCHDSWHHDWRWPALLGGAVWQREQGFCCGRRPAKPWSIRSAGEKQRFVVHPPEQLAAAEPHSQAQQQGSHTGLSHPKQHRSLHQLWWRYEKPWKSLLDWWTQSNKHRYENNVVNDQITVWGKKPKNKRTILWFRMNDCTAISHLKS